MALRISPVDECPRADLRAGLEDSRDRHGCLGKVWGKFQFAGNAHANARYDVHAVFERKGTLAFLGRRESFVGRFRVSSAMAVWIGVSAFGVAHLCVEPQCGA
ncbi:hypothetical protein [Stenotrophomonas panacihumi]|uniref:hypothetical protein n=1 Tax=Stenotrophomonas panacihumi TaxID=676599 RepID=UPI0011B25ED3|nr:hypothetical protein [Stenotrophomonas panacihumi]